MSKWFRTVLIFSFILLFTLFTFWGIWDMYFQQDEWNGFGKVLYAQKYGYWSLIRVYGSHFTPLSSLFFAFLFNMFGYRASGYAWYSLFLHGINGILVYMLALKMSQRMSVALFAAFWFISAYVSRQAVTWFAASPSFLPAVFFSLHSLILFEDYLIKQKIVLLYVAIGLCFIALGFRENVVFLFGYIIVRTFFMRRQLFKKTAVVSVSSGIVYCTMRFLPMVQNSTGSANVHMGSIIAQTLDFTFISLPQMLITRGLSINFFRWIMELPFGMLQQIKYSMNVPVLIEAVIIRWFFFIVWILLAIFLYVFITRFVKKTDKKTVYSLIVFILLSVLPFSLLPRSVFMESRHFYLSVTGFSVLLGYVFSILVARMIRNIKIVVALCFIGIVLVNAKLIRKGIQDGRVLSSTRHEVVTKLASLYPMFPTRVIIFGEGDLLPFQSGDGYKLMVLYHDKQPYHSFLKEDFLWNIGSEGYKEKDSVGFGYFTTYNTMLDTYCRQQLFAENVFSFSWNEKAHTITDTTEQTRKKLICRI